MDIYISDILSDILSGSFRHSFWHSLWHLFYKDLALAVDVQCTLRSAAHRWGLAVPTCAHWDLELAAIRGCQRRRKEGGRMRQLGWLETLTWWGKGIRWNKYSKKKNKSQYVTTCHNCPEAETQQLQLPSQAPSALQASDDAISSPSVQKQTQKMYIIC